jgi:glycosyltransferase involved in cell wall biosynthesis
MKSILCLIVKNEAQDIAEWIVHHACLGFHRIVIYDNDSNDGTGEIIKRLALRYPIEHIAWSDGTKPIEGLTKQGAAYTDCIERYRGRTEWIGFIDSDEFLIPPSVDATIADLLGEHDRYGAFAINWLIFGSGGLETSKGRLVLEAFDRRSRAEFNANRHVKMFIRPETAKYVLNPHYIETEEPCRNLDGDLVSWSERGIVEPERILLRPWRLHHYFIRSREHWRRRTERGQPGGWVREWEKFSDYDRNDVIDTAAIPFAQRARSELLSLDFEVGPVPDVAEQPSASMSRGSANADCRPSDGGTRRQTSRIHCILDAIDNELIKGWAVDPDGPGKPVVLRAEFDNRTYIRFVCDVSRKDVLRSTNWDEHVGYRLSVPPLFMDGQPHRFRLLDAHNKVVRFALRSVWFEEYIFTLPRPTPT